MTKPLTWPRSHRRSNARQPLHRAKARRLITELQALHEIGRVISKAWRLADVLETIYAQTSRLMETRDFYIALCDPDRQMIEFSLVMARGRREYWPPRRWGNGLTEWLIEHRQALRLDAREIDPSLEPIIVGEPPKSFLGVPIILGDQTLGVISVQSLERFDAYSERDAYILAMIADQAAVAIANAQRYAAVDKQLNQRVAELEALAETVRDLNATLDADIILQRLVERACVTTGADAGMVCLVVDEGRSLLVKSLRGYPEEVGFYQRGGWSVNRGLAGYVVRTGASDWTPDVRLSPHYVVSRPGTLSQMTVPIIHGDAVLGVLILESDHLGAFGPALTRFITQIAEHAALSIHNAYIHQQAVHHQLLIMQHSQQLREVLRISQALSANLQIDALLPEIVRSVRASLGFNIALLSLVDTEDPTMMRRRAMVGVPQEQWALMQTQLVPIAWYRSVMRDEFRISQSYFIPGTAADYTMIWNNPQFESYQPDLGERDPDEWAPEDALFVPLFDSAGHLISVLSVDDPSDRRRPSFESVQVLEIFATQAAIALENANLYATTQQMAMTDGLTGLHNQRHFMTLLDREVSLAHRYSYPLTFLALDLDFFKVYNDTYGHVAGNILLRDFADLLRENVREVDIVARTGGEEFAIILPKTDTEGALQLAERLRSTTEHYPFAHNNVTVSIGLATLEPGIAAATLYDLADQALYAAKRGGRNNLIAAPRSGA